MANVENAQKPEPVAKLYAKALFELAVENKDLDRVKQDLTALNEMFQESPRLYEALSMVMFSDVEREKIADEVAEKSQLHPLLQRFLKLLVQRNRVPQLPAICASFREFVDTSNGTIRGTVTTVENLSQNEVAELSQAFAKKLNKKVILEPVVNKEILGGLVVNIQGLTFDGSLKTTLRRLQENLERQSI